MNAQSHTEFVDGFYRISQDRANKIVILAGAGGDFITDVDWPSFDNVAEHSVASRRRVGQVGAFLELSPYACHEHVTQTLD